MVFIQFQKMGLKGYFLRLEIQEKMGKLILLKFVFFSLLQSVILSKKLENKQSSRAVK